MSVRCPNCQAENADADAFCRSCGQALRPSTQGAPQPTPPASQQPPPPAAPPPTEPAPSTAAAPEQPSLPPPTPAAGQPPAAGQAPAAAAPPGAPPAQPYQSPDYAPPPGGPPVTRRLPMAVIVGGAVAALLVVGGVGAAVALVAGGGDDGPSPPPIVGASATPGGIATPAPTPPGGIATPASTPAGGSATPTPTPAPTPAPTPTPAAQGGDTQLIDVEYVSIEVPADWQVAWQEQTSIGVVEPDTRGLLIVTSGGIDPGTTLEAFQQSIISDAQASYADAQVCGGPDPVQTGPGLPTPGTFFSLCYTVTPQSGAAFVAADIYYVAIQDSTVFMMNYYSHLDVWEAFTGEAYRLTAPIWKLFSP